MEIKEAIEQLKTMFSPLRDLGSTMRNRALRLAIETLEKMEDGRLVEVVRCKDCRYYTGANMCNVMDDGYKIYKDEDDFCSWGEKAKEGIKE